MKATITHTQTEISAAAIYYVTDRTDFTKFFLVKSDSSECYHEVRWDEERLAWTCNGEHCRFARGGTACKHARAASEVMQLRRAAEFRLQAQEERALRNLASGKRLSRDQFTAEFGIYE